MSPIKMPTGAALLLDKLTEKGFFAYIVGGCVRDSLLGLLPKDWDICTSAKPEEVKACLPDQKIIETGLKHGTVTVLLPDGQYEVTTFRIDGAYSDNRRPDFVEFVTDITADLARRDFTVNAMAYNGKEGLADPFGGQKDLQKGVIRCVGDPEKRFCEDGLRIMRAIRFASVYGFSIEAKTAGAIHSQAHLLRNIAAERIREELCKLLLGTDALTILLEYRDIVATVIPEFEQCFDFEQSMVQTGTVYDHIARSVSYYKGNDISVCMALFLHDIAKPFSDIEEGGSTPFDYHAKLGSEMADCIAKRMRFDNKTRRNMVQLIFYHETEIEPTERSVRHLLNEVGERQFFRLMEVKRADLLAQESNGQKEKLTQCEEVIKIAKKILAAKQCLTLDDLAVNGTDVIALGIREGKRVGDLLLLALNAVLDGAVENNKNDLLQYIRIKIDGEDPY